ncbi:hypothetical protein FQA47_021284 [Oryzias melastigma]|uniref:Uncharacterized protein n=1 Tax=Oryzias melastigma TaxID=30732 RepID=A0A834FP25_ORYME|nr:hypothetical protein FQA47_021284 [Oryzias melastigma]
MAAPRLWNRAASCDPRRRDNMLPASPPQTRIGALMLSAASDSRDETSVTRAGLMTATSGYFFKIKL